MPTSTTPTAVDLADTLGDHLTLLRPLLRQAKAIVEAHREELAALPDDAGCDDENQLWQRSGMDALHRAGDPIREGIAALERNDFHGMPDLAEPIGPLPTPAAWIDPSIMRPEAVAEIAEVVALLSAAARLLRPAIIAAQRLNIEFSGIYDALPVTEDEFGDRWEEVRQSTGFARLEHLLEQIGEAARIEVGIHREDVTQLLAEV